MGRISNGLRLIKSSFHVLRMDKEIMILPLLSGAFLVLLTALLIAGILYAAPVGLLAPAAFLCYILCYFIIIFFNAAVIHCATLRFDGVDPKVADGIRYAASNAKLILEWAVVSATVGLILRLISKRVRWVEKMVIAAIGAAWGVATYFVVPVLIYERIGPLAAIRRSVSVLKRTWGETIVGGFGVGLIFFMLSISGLIFPIIGVIFGGGVGGLVGLLMFLIYAIAVACAYLAINGVLISALYRYATRGEIPSLMPRDVIANPWSGF